MVQETHDAPAGRAIGLLLFGVMAGLGLDLCAKAILETYSLEQFVFLRSAIGLTIFLSLSYRFGGLAGLSTRRWGWHLLRTMLASGAMFGFFYGLASMPLIDALTLGFTAPLMTTALSVPLLGDRVGWRRWTAVITGFLGVLMILRPGGGAMTFASFAVLFAAFCYACLAISARRLAPTESTYSLSVYVVAGPMIISGLMSTTGSAWRMPDLAAILDATRIPVKVSCPINEHNAHRMDAFLARCRDIGVRRLAIRQMYGDERQWQILPHTRPVRVYRNNPVYDLDGMEVTHWRFENTTSTALNLFADGTISHSYLLIKAR